MRFYLGAPEVCWLKRTAVPLFVSYSRLRRYKRVPVALGPSVIDSMGFNELKKHGRWTVTAREYARDVERYINEVGRIQWASIQDWMCEPLILRKTGKTLAEHQDLTIRSYLDLRDLAPSVPWAPVLQGWDYADYFRHIEKYRLAGIDLEDQPIVGLGSVCTRQDSSAIVALTHQLAPIRLHGFGCKAGALRRGARLVSADSMAWSSKARYAKERTPGHTHERCVSCLPYALEWREQVLRSLNRNDGPMFALTRAA